MFLVASAVVAFVEWDATAKAAQAVLAGARAFLVKPLQAEELLNEPRGEEPMRRAIARAKVRPGRYRVSIVATDEAGNLYVNRNQIGARVGVQPFGGEGLSGTGPKAGGPNYVARFAVERVRTDDITATGGNAELLRVSEG